MVNDGKELWRGLGLSTIFCLFPKFIDFQSRSRVSYLSVKGLPVVYFDILYLSGANPFSTDVRRVFYSYFSFYTKENILCVKDIYNVLCLS